MNKKFFIGSRSFEVIRYDTENIDEIKKMISSSGFFINSRHERHGMSNPEVDKDTGKLRVVTPVGFRHADFGDYIVLDDNGGISVVDPYSFSQMFTIADGETIDGIDLDWKSEDVDTDGKLKEKLVAHSGEDVAYEVLDYGNTCLVYAYAVTKSGRKARIWYTSALNIYDAMNIAWLFNQERLNEYFKD